jgi:hypothetical protein
MPLSQRCPGAQSALTAHAVLHAVVPQANGTQVTRSGVTQPPAPSQRASGVASVAVQLPARQTKSGPGYPSHVPRTLPSHERPEQASDPAGQAALGARGAPMTAEHTPIFPGSAQASQIPVQAVSQQTPSMQKPEAHCAPVTQLAPLPRSSKK